MLRQHFAAVFLHPYRCSEEAIRAVFPYAAGFLVGIVTAAAVMAAVLITLPVAIVLP